MNKNMRFLPVVLLILIEASCSRHDKETDIIKSSESFIKLSEAQIQLANINTTRARTGFISHRLSLPGTLKINEQSTVTISARLKGRIEKLYFKNSGSTVRKGDKLYEFYSEELVDAQREYLNLQSNNWNYSGKYEPSLILKDKLLVMGLMMSQIQQLEKDRKILFRVTILSPADGKIRSVEATEGQYVNEGESLFELASDNKLWVESQVYPDEAHLFEPGMQAIVTVPAAGEIPQLCNIIFVNPAVEPGKNVVLIRASIDNTENKFRPGMMAMMYVRTKTSHGIIVPASAVISGSGGDRIWIRDENENFLYRTVTTGLQSGDSIQVLSGIQNDDMVVYTGAYLLNSEYILRNGTGVSKAELPEFNIGKTER